MIWSRSRAAYSNSSMRLASFISFSSRAIVSARSRSESFFLLSLDASSALRLISTISRTPLRMVWGTMPCALLKSSCNFRRRSVSSMAARMEGVMVSAYRITKPSALRAARPMVWIRLVSLRRKPSLSASSMATRLTSGRSRPSRSRLMPTSTSNSPSRRSRMISMRSSADTSACMYRTRMPSPRKCAVRSSAIFFVSVVTSTRSFFCSRLWISSTRSSICPTTGRTSTRGSSRPVGRITCSTIWSASCFSKSPGVADTYTAWENRSSNSSNFSGRLSKAQGRRKP